MEETKMAETVEDIDEIKFDTEEQKSFFEKGKQVIIQAFDENGNGEIDLEDIIIKSMKIPGIKINRENFLRKELFKYVQPEMIEQAILTNPAKSGVSVEIIDKIADEVIAFERNCVSGISAALGIPGGYAMLATIPADMVQYYGYMLRAAQKLMYLYGFPQIIVEDKQQILDSETMNILILCLGTMQGVAGTKNALLVMCRALGEGVEKKLLRTALTKGTIYPAIKQTLKWFGVNLTKKIFADFVKKAIPVVGGIIGGGITFISFKPCCDRLKESLHDSILMELPKVEDNDTED